MTQKTPLKTLSLTEARQQLSQFPKQFDIAPEPVLIEYHGDLSMSLMGFETFAMYSGAFAFVHEMGLKEYFLRWLEDFKALPSEEPEEGQIVEARHQNGNGNGNGHNHSVEAAFVVDEEDESPAKKIKKYGTRKKS